MSSTKQPGKAGMRNLIRRSRAAVQKKGLRATASFGKELLLAQPKRLDPRKNYIFLAHPLDMTGAPLVLLQILTEFAQSKGAASIRLFTPNTSKDYMQELRALRIKPERIAGGLSRKLIRHQLGIKRDSFVFINTCAVADSYLNAVFGMLESGALKHAYWFIHEDIPQMKVINKKLLSDNSCKQIQKLIKNGSLTILVPSTRIKTDYDKIFGTKDIKVETLRVDVDEAYKKPRKATDYSVVKFVLSGVPSDGRKGQLIAISAFHEFINTNLRDNPKLYRKFELHLIAMRDDYLSQQIISNGQSILDDRFKYYPSLPKPEALKVMHGCNAVICCSLNETFALYVAEGMMMGHIVLRNGSAGMEEQLEEGKNGYYIDHTDIKQFADRIETLLNTSRTTDDQLRAMGATSQEIAKAFEEKSYLESLTY